MDLRDQRQARLEELAEFLPVEVRDNADGQMQIFTRAADGSEVALIDPPAVTGPVVFDGTALTAGNPAVALGGALPVRLPAPSPRATAPCRPCATNSICSHQTVTAVNATYNPSATAGADFFATARTAPGPCSSKPASPPPPSRAGTGAAGDNSLALAVSALATTTFSTSSGDFIDGTLASITAAR